jgi:hypothetical protein
MSGEKLTSVDRKIIIEPQISQMVQIFFWFNLRNLWISFLIWGYTELRGEGAEDAEKQTFQRKPPRSPRSLRSKRYHKDTKGTKLLWKNLCGLRVFVVFFSGLMIESVEKRSRKGAKAQSFQSKNLRESAKSAVFSVES